MIRHLATPASSQTYILAEGPVWDAARQRVLWVDITAGEVLSGHLQGDKVIVDQQLSFPETVGAVVCSAAGELLVAGSRGLFTVTAGTANAGDTAETGGTAETGTAKTGTAKAEPVATVPGPTLIPAGKNSRLNDGGCDPAGRFLVGSIALDDRQDDEQLLRIDGSGQVTVIDDQLGLSNGLAWSPDGTWFYSIDTTPGLVWIRSYDSDSGRYGERRVLLNITDGHPDGMCVDAEGNLWVAIWGAGEVRCFSPTGAQLASVEVAAPNTSSVAFVGPGLDTLLITTASEQLSATQLDQYPDSGKLFTVAVGVTGLPVPYWSGKSVNH